MALQSKKLKRSLHTNNLLIQFSFSDSKHKPFGLTKTKAPRKYLTSQAYFASSNPAPAQARISLWLYLPRFSEYTFCFRMLHMRAHHFFFILPSFFVLVVYLFFVCNESIEIAIATLIHIDDISRWSTWIYDWCKHQCWNGTHAANLWLEKWVKRMEAPNYHFKVSFNVWWKTSLALVICWRQFCLQVYNFCIIRCDSFCVPYSLIENSHRLS